MRITAILWVGLLGGLSFALAANADVHSFRYEVTLLSGDPAFKHEITGDELRVGPREDVETDKQGKILSVTYYENGKQTERDVYHFDAGAHLSKGYDAYIGGALSSKQSFTRDAQGNRIKVEKLTAGGELTRYWTTTYLSDHASLTVYGADGKAVRSFDYYFSPQGELDRVVTYESPTKTLDNAYDTDTGKPTAMKIVIDGKLDHTKQSTYDANGMLSREDLYDVSGQWYGVMEYSDELKVRESYKYPDGSTEEIRTTYDDNRFGKQAKLFVNDQLECIFQYERFPNGVIKSTLAYGPNGDLYAEYPDNYVDYVDRQGTPLMQVPKMVIHKVGDWW
jgi:antitoxin component YwqK of YwqJK toxin-antitoxin module